MQTLKTTVLVVLAVLIAVVMVQNAQPVTFKFLNWSYQVSQLLLVMIVFMVGWLTGFVGAKLRRKQHDDEPPLTTAS